MLFTQVLFNNKKYKNKTVKSAIKVFVICLLVGSLAACTAVKLITSTKLTKPEFKYVDRKVGKANKHDVPIELYFEAYNPNEIGLKNIFISYDFLIEGERFLHGQDIEIHLAPQGMTKIVVPADVVYKDIFKALGPVGKYLLFKSPIVPVEVQVTIEGVPTVYNEIEEGALFMFSFSISKVVPIPVPYEKINNAIDKAKQDFNKFRDLF